MNFSMKYKLTACIYIQRNVLLNFDRYEENKRVKQHYPEG